MDNLNQIIDNLLGKFGNTLPRIVAAIVILILGLMIARYIKGLVKRLLKKSGIDEKMDPHNKTAFSLSDSLSKIVYWVLLVYLFLYVLSMIGVSGVLEPLSNMINEITGYVPNILGAGLIGFIGYMIANIGKEAVGMVSDGIEGLGSKLGISTNFNLTNLFKQLAFLLIFIPVILVALDTLNIETISGPAKNMLESLFNAIPNIIAAAIILVVFLVGGKFISGVVKDLLVNLKVDNSLSEMGVSSIIGNRSFSDMAGKVVYFFLVVFGLISATERLEFAKVSDILNQILELSGHILFGAVILLVGNQISLFIKNYFDKTGAGAVSTIARFATLGLFLAISLRYMGIADDIVNLAFGLTLGAVAVAFALSFGLGGREAAGDQMKRFFNKLNSK